MKTINKFLILLFAISLSAVTNSRAQLFSSPLVVRAIPAAPKGMKKVDRPNKYAVWIPEEWGIAENRYIYRAGYWSYPPTPKSVYIPGYWHKASKGYYRVPGYWKNPHV